ncbi:MAG: M20/M25/M40 family metallo-hydrolase [Planctomycetes bacterium]|nr:M20/M25/M40 family metallo-hydrolase [Planctomycetota bacterium]
MMRILAWGSLLLLPAAAQESKSDRVAAEALDGACALIQADGLRAHLEYLAGDELEGRCAGYEGERKATEYIARHFEKLGLRPVGDKDEKSEPTYFQEFDLRGRRPRNTVAFCEGSDPRLKEEIVILGAHHDHVGKAGQANAGRRSKAGAPREDKIWNGADDNGSGTVTVLEIARAFMEGKIRTKRSVLFMTFSGEEFGLLGSRHYVRNPLFPIEKTAAMINMDMVGRNPEKEFQIKGVGSAAKWKELVQHVGVETGVSFKTVHAVHGGTDYYNFARAKIPTVDFFTDFHPDYHCQTDHPDKIAYERMEKIGRFVLRLLVATANLPERMEYVETIAQGRAPRRVLGIGTEELTAEERKEHKLGEDGGIRVTRVSEDSVAAKFGMREGDILVEINGKKFPADDPVALLRRELGRIKDDQDVPIVLLRKGERIELNVKWEKK